MRLSESEILMVERLRRSTRYWKWTRWMFLAMAALLIVAAEYIWNFILESDPTTSPIRVAFLLPLFVFSVSIAGCLVGFTVGQWQGNIRSKLLVRLIDELSEDKEIRTKPSNATSEPAPGTGSSSVQG